LQAGEKRRNSQDLSQALTFIQRALVAEGHSQTKPRRQVLEAFLSHGEPLTSAGVLRQLTDRRINLASVYRAIKLFCRLGVLCEVDHVHEGQRYELSDQYRGHHHHLICGSCGKTQDFEDCKLEELEKIIRRRFHFKVTRHDLRFIGLCQRCQQ
jgi:Fur family ferric uptake transcriptional regulator